MTYPTTADHANQMNQELLAERQKLQQQLAKIKSEMERIPKLLWCICPTCGDATRVAEVEYIPAVHVGGFNWEGVQKFKGLCGHTNDLSLLPREVREWLRIYKAEN